MTSFWGSCENVAKGCRGETVLFGSLVSIFSSSYEEKIGVQLIVILRSDAVIDSSVGGARETFSS